MLFNLSTDSLASGPNKLGPWHPDVSGGELQCMAVEAFLYMAITIAVEYDVFKAASWHALYNRARGVGLTAATAAIAAADADDADGDYVEDEGVRTERIRADDLGAPSAYSLVVRNLRKQYARPGGASEGNDGIVRAVKGVSVVVPEGECFGLLGVNGAGKTTTFKMLSGQFPPSSGDAIVAPHVVHPRCSPNTTDLDNQSTISGSGDGIGSFSGTSRGTPGSPGSPSYSILNQLARVRQHVGYCPQYDALQSTMTAVDHLLFYGALRGLTGVAAAAAADSLVDRLGLRHHAHLTAGGYSGGTRRKLSVAIALVGDPAVVLLDEPSTGMDPESRRQLWAVLASAIAGRCMVLTSHSMEECEALCHRVGIMVGGRLRCVGPVQHLKSGYGDGYTLDLRVPDDDAAANTNDNAADLRVFATSPSGGSRRAAVRRFVRDELPGAVLVEERATRLRYRLPPALPAEGGGGRRDGGDGGSESGNGGGGDGDSPSLDGEHQLLASLPINIEGGNSYSPCSVAHVFDLLEASKAKNPRP